MQNVINNHYLLTSTENLLGFKECDFNLKNSDKNNNIPLTLKERKDPLLILFYFDNTSREILHEWKVVSESITPIPGTGLLPKEEDEKITLAHVNLDFEKNILDNFKNVQNSNPFVWTKIKNKSINSFVIFYYNRYPQYYYNGFINRFLIENEFNEWKNQLENNEDDKNRKFRNIGSRIVGKEAIFRATGDEYLVDSTGKIVPIKQGELYKVLSNEGGVYQLFKIPE